MREPAPDYSRHRYERPNQPWACGLVSDGQACPAGPTVRGQCPALAECVPARDGDRWQCNRSPLRGGVCTDGPTPEGACSCVHRCRPVRSLRTIRGRFVTACTLLAAGALLILLSADWRDRAISPGPLARQHAQLLENNVSEPNCAACHAAAEQGAAGWTASLVGLHGGGLDQSQRCMNCHDKTISPKFALAAHGLPPDTLQELTVVKKKGSEQFSDPPIKNSSDPFLCAACHREHRGSEFDLTTMNDAACQSCHQQRYDSFATDHPDFGAWPYERRTRIAFNHASHRAKHFVDKQQTFDCRSCHLDDATGNVQLLANYEIACASCHDEKIATSVARGVPIIALPTLDVDALTAAAHDIGPWPQATTGDFDGRLPPMMKLLLAADPDAAAAMATLGEDFEFFDIDPRSPQQLAACAALAMAIKKLFAELRSIGPAAAGQRLNASLGYNISATHINSLFSGLAEDTLQSALKAWLPEIIEGTNDWIKRMGAVPSGSPRRLAYDPAGAWTRDDATLTIRYHPAAHADPVLAGWLELVAATPELARHPLALAMFREQTKPTAPGLCTSCHSVEQSAGGQLTINWRAYDRTSEARSFTKFSHGPHLMLPQLADCTSCHAIDGSIDTASSYATEYPHSFVSEFAPLSKQHCVQCHNVKAAGESCQKCHNYHVDSLESWRLK